MNASSQLAGCDVRGWRAVQAALASATIAISCLTLGVEAADWSLGDASSAPQVGAVLIADEALSLPASGDLDAGSRIIAEDENGLVLGDAPSIIEQQVDHGFETEGVLPSPAQAVGMPEEPLTSHMISDGLCHPNQRCPRWTAQIDALLLWQTNMASRPLYVDAITRQTVLDANQAIPPVSAAPRYALMYHRDPCHAFEINYFQIQSFAGDAVVGPGPNFYAPDNLPGAAFADIVAAQVITSASLKSWEFNLRRSQGGMVTWIGGFRWVEWNQQLGIGDLNAFGATGFDGYLVNTGNNLYGGQLGADLLLWNAYRCIKVNGLAKGGVYYNHQAYQNTTLAGDVAVVPPDSSTLGATKDSCAFLGEVALVGEYKIAEWLSWRAGYTLFWLGGIATPTNQLALSDFTAQTTSVNTYSSAFLHGVTTGLEAQW